MLMRELQVCAISFSVSQIRSLNKERESLRTGNRSQKSAMFVFAEELYFATNAYVTHLNSLEQMTKTACLGLTQLCHLPVA